MGKAYLLYLHMDAKAKINGTVLPVRLLQSFAVDRRNILDRVTIQESIEILMSIEDGRGQWAVGRASRQYSPRSFSNSVPPSAGRVSNSIIDWQQYVVELSGDMMGIALSESGPIRLSGRIAHWDF